MQRLEAFGHYDLIERINVGGTGEVFRAVERREKRLVALKRLMPFASIEGGAATELLEGEATLARALDHPAIAKVTDYGSFGAHHFIVYEFVLGRDLRAIQERAKRIGGIPLDIAIVLAMQIGSALAHAHARLDADGKPLGIIHRDVTPANILVAYDGGAKLSDFGIARVRGRGGHAGADDVRGTLGYMSPEQISGGVIDARSDIYSLGVCLWELATGRRLFEGSPEVVLRRIALGDLPAPGSVNPRVTEALERVILKALAQSPDQRYANAEEFLDDLSALSSASFPQADGKRVESFLRTLFPEAAAEVAASREESLNMSDDKGGSDLDIFEGLAAKKSQRAPAPGLMPPPSIAPPLAAPPRAPSVAPPPPPAPPPRSPAQTMMGGLVVPPPSPAPSISAPPLAAKPPPPPANPLPPPANPLPPLASPASTGMLAPSLKPPPPPQRPSAIPPPPSAPLTATGLGPGAPGLLPHVSAPPPRGGPSVTSVVAPLPPPPGRPTAGSLPPLAPPEKKRSSSGKAAVDMDWDDDEESTHVFDKQRHEPLQSSRPKPPSKALMAASGHVAPPPPPAPMPAAMPAAMPKSLPPPAAPPKAAAVSAPPQPPRDIASARALPDESTAVRGRIPAGSRASGGRLGLLLGGVGVALIGVIAVVLLLPRTGQFRIDVKLKSGGSVDKAEIYVDGQKKCEATPCVVSDLPAGLKSIKVIAGADAETTTETIEPGKEKAVLVTLEHGAGATGSSSGTGVKATTTMTTPVKINVDGADKGTLPADFRDLTPGTHKVKFDAGDRYEHPDAKSIDIGPNEMKDLGNVALKVVKGQLTLELGTTGATVTLVRNDNGRKVEKKLSESLWKSPPVKIDIPTSEGWRLVATKKGKSDFRQDITFDDGQAEKTIRIDLSDKDDLSASSTTSSSISAATSKTTPDTPTPPETSGKTDSGGNGTLNLNSIPVSKVILDGKPLGSTPKLGLSVSPGSHTVTFITSDGDKKSMSVNVKAGETKTAATKF